MATFTYKNTGDTEIVIPNYGAVAPGDTIDLAVAINNPALQAVTAKEAKKASKK